MDLNLRLEPGHIYGLLGPNGAGKTTLMKLLAGLRFVNSGNCDVLGHLPLKRPVALLENLYYLPERVPSLSGSVRSFIRLYSPFYPNFGHEQFKNCLTLFDLDEKEKLSGLSFGQTRKFPLSFAIATRCRLLLLDEPTNGLDIPGKSRFRKLMASSLTEDSIFVIASHQIKDVELLIDHYLFIDQGKIIFDHPCELISSKLTFFRSSAITDQDCLYHEPYPGGVRVLAAREKENESEMDVELLFNAVMSDAKKITTLLTKEAGGEKKN